MKHPAYYLAILMVIGLFSTQHTQGQDTTFDAYTSVVGNLSAGQSDEWSFNAVDGEVVSFFTEASSTLDPVLTLQTETGAVLTFDDDYDYPNTTNSIIQALTIPYTGTYTIRVTAYGDTSGSYTLTRLRGFAEGFDLNSFADTTNWNSNTETLDIASNIQQVTLSLKEPSTRALIVDSNANILEDFYAQVDVNVITGRPDWTVLLTPRQQSMENYYLLALDSQGRWRFTLNQGETEIILRDWGTHPAIRAGETEFTLGIMANGNGFDVFYNSNLLGQVIDNTYQRGILGFGTSTNSGVDINSTIQFSNLLITVPKTKTNNTTLIPQQLILGDAPSMAQDLERRQLIPTGGELALSVPESTTQSIDVGVSKLALGRGVTFENFVFGGEVSIQSNDNTLPSACGLFLRSATDDDYILAYLEQNGNFGLTERQGDTFSSGLYNDQQQFNEGEHQLLIIANQNILHYYIDGQYVGQIESTLTAGTIGNAVVNFEPNTTFCNYQNTWIWSW